MDEKWKISKKDAAKIAIGLVLIVGFLIWQKLDTSTPGQLVLTGITNDHFYGKVDSVFRDKWDHNAKKVRLNTGYVYSLYPEWESKVELGDSLSKKRGSFFVEVIKRNSLKDTLDYTVLVKSWKK